MRILRLEATAVRHGVASGQAASAAHASARLASSAIKGARSTLDHLEADLAGRVPDSNPVLPMMLVFAQRGEIARALCAQVDHAASAAMAHSFHADEAAGKIARLLRGNAALGGPVRPTLDTLSESARDSAHAAKLNEASAAKSLARVDAQYATLQDRYSRVLPAAPPLRPRPIV